MSERDSVHMDKAATDAEQPSDYEAPRILFRQPLEGVAAACTPQPPGKASGICEQGFS